MKTRLLGAAVLIALAVLFLPMIFSSAPPKTDADQTVSLEIPPAPDRELQTRTLDVAPNGAPASVAGAQVANGPVPQAPIAAAPAGDKLASVNIASRKPADALPEDFANQPQPKPASARSTPAPKPVTPVATAPVKPAAPVAATPVAPAEPAGTAARGSYTINLSAYADHAKADALVSKVRGLGYPVTASATTQAGKALTRVTAGPFESRTAAEAARLKITSSVPGVPASLSAGSSSQQADVAPRAPAPVAAAPAGASPAPAAASAPHAGGFAVQLAAVSSEVEATRLRDKVRAAGIAGYVDTVSSSSGAKLWRVRAGPQTQRDDAVRLKEQVKAKLGIDGVVVTAP
ncbi:SPOR domain-containing protein [Luteibacter rhizovicinus]|uniref:SPOR domain-containing protein n=1 Tax=Luteibacter rhizovicinus TaxID=242606 RepID=UPI00104AEC27|nr:SPOR domain-containing protein [Luteibacter rhizovicinus]